MINIKLELKNVVEQTMIPESKAFLDELNELISSINACNDDIEAKKDMESFLQELNTILNAIEKDEVNRFIEVGMTQKKKPKIYSVN